MTRVSDGPRLLHATGQEGFGLVEAIVAAAVLAVIALGVLAGIDGAAGSAGREKARAIASALAEEDQERLRAMRAADLPGYRFTDSKDVGGSRYTIVSEADWISDTSNAAVSCQANGGKADYLRLRTTVTSAIVGPRTAPVQMNSIMAPPIGTDGGNNGTLAVQVLNRDEQPVVNLPVSISGKTTARTDSEVTNAAGCAIFAFIPPDAYDVSFEAAGWVNPNGVQKVVMVGQTVTAGNSTQVSSLYDQKGALSATFDTVHWSPSTGSFTTVASRGWALTLANPRISINGGQRIFAATDGSPQERLSAVDLFPFKDGYGVYSGRCTEENPSAHDDDVWAGVNAFRFVDRNALLNMVVRQPALPVRVSLGRSGGSPVWFDNANVQAKLIGLASDSQCTAAPDLISGLTSFPIGTPSSGTPANNYLDGYRGLVTKRPPAGQSFAAGYFDPGLPWGRWQVCADNGIQRNFTTVTNNKPDGFRSDDSSLAAFKNLRIDATSAQPGTCALGNWPAAS